MRSLSITFFLAFMSSMLCAQSPSGYSTLVTLYEDWRVFQRPPLVDDIPDYSPETMQRQYKTLPSYRTRLASIDTAGWPISARVDYLLLWAEMNGMEFDHTVLRPWERMPGFYAHVWLEQSDVPAHEGPVAHGALDGDPRRLRQLAHADEVVRKQVHHPFDQIVTGHRPLLGDRIVADVVRHG